MTKLSTQLPGESGAGLHQLAEELIADPHKVHVVIALIDCKETKTDQDSGEITPTARIRRLEVVDAQDRSVVQRMMARAAEVRSGQTMLPFDLEAATTAAFGDIDPDTGEVIEDEK